MIALSLAGSVLLVLAGPGVGSATAQIEGAMSSLQGSTGESAFRTDLSAQLASLTNALIRLPIATALAALLAFRPRRTGTPERQASVIQTQIILAIVGAIVMLVVGASLARAFGIVGAAGLIRYRAKVEDPKDAGVMLSTLAIGLACGVGLYLLAIFAAAFVVAVLWAVESIEPMPLSRFELTVTSKDAAAELRPMIEETLRRHRVRFELRAASADDLCFEVTIPSRRNTDAITTALMALAPQQEVDVKWDKKKNK